MQTRVLVTVTSDSIIQFRIAVIITIIIIIITVIIFVITTIILLISQGFSYHFSS
jgi:hypothetical protein